MPPPSYTHTLLINRSDTLFYTEIKISPIQISDSLQRIRNQILFPIAEKSNTFFLIFLEVDTNLFSERVASFCYHSNFESTPRRVSIDVVSPYLCFVAFMYSTNSSSKPDYIMNSHSDCIRHKRHGRISPINFFFIIFLTRLLFVSLLLLLLLPPTFVVSFSSPPPTTPSRPPPTTNRRSIPTTTAFQTARLTTFRTPYSTTTKLKSIMSGTGFIGLGIMGEGMAARLLTQSITGTTDSPLYVWNRTKSKCTDFAAKYSTYNIIIKETAKEVVESASITYCMLSTPEASKAVFEADDGVLAGISEGKQIVDCATLAEADMIRMNDAVVSKGGQFLEAPVSGSKVPAAQGQLIFLCAGSKVIFDAIVENGLNAMGKASHFFSETVGFGTRAKLVVNSLMGTMVAAFSEALALAENTGLDPSKMIEVIGQGAIQVCR